jgi:hypothetical protein
VNAIRREDPASSRSRSRPSDRRGDRPLGGQEEVEVGARVRGRR